MTTSDLAQTEAVLERPASAPVVAQAPAATNTSISIEDALQGILGDKVGSPGSTSGGTKISVQEVKIYPTFVEMEVKGIRKTVSLMDFKQMIDSQLQVETKMEMLQLPEGCYQVSKSQTEMQLACYFPERKLDLKYMDKVFKGCAMPNVIISHKLRYDNGIWVVNDTRYLATDKTIAQLPEGTMLWEPDARNHLWLMPFPNFYTEGRMCYGGNTMPVRHSNNLRGLKYFYDVIAVSPFNNDLGLHATWSLTCEDWFKHLAALEKFDYKYMRGR